jgi:hypothetical protein
MPNPRKQDRELDALYAQLPALRCQGYCADSCGPIDMSVRERSRIVERARKAVKCEKGGLCNMLDENRRCTVYDIRPLICRLWGLTRSLACPYGCRPERWLTDAESARFLVEAERIGGSPLGDRAQRAMALAIGSLDEKEMTRIAREVIGPGRGTLEGRTVALHRAGLRMPFEREGIPIDEDKIGFPKQEGEE